ncbi:CPBP family intramembrane glutamic endopeptidase [Mucilaginibacter sp. FT3.2]|uniref:CPBP family intramembrane glutamic endopeptidase n=1 Tax=Mucilaginibacter sp. FT3.2 TaxID=2723090 RepID=UPI0016110BA3|nr:type II CAAX endopeptidase family protein [Mucilaginibacter sp. FT3.2]MBB6231801.1 hypothetical protein [Mucilaginibacter sp. FT3.2]
MYQDQPEPTPITYPGDTRIATDFTYPNWKSLFKLFFIFLLYSIAGGILLGVFFADAKNLATPLVKAFLSLVLYVLTMLFTVMYAVKKSKKLHSSTAFDFSFNKITGWVVPVVIISTLALVVGLERIADIVPMPAAVQKVFEKMFTKNPFSLINMIIAAPIMEEILCRAVVLKGLLKNYSPQKAIVISAVFFAILHLNPWQALPAFFGGLFLGWVFYKTRSVIPGMIIHATINASASLVLFLPKYQHGFLSALGMPYYLVLCVCAILVFGAGYTIIQKKFAQVE